MTRPSTALFGCQQAVCLPFLCAPTPKPYAILLRIMHDYVIEKATGKRQIIVGYNTTKQWIDVVDKLCSTQIVTKKTSY